jgi:hypothetical protein
MGRNAMLGLTLMMACTQKEAPSSTTDEKPGPRTEQATAPTDPACALPVTSLISSDIVIKEGCRVAVDRSYQLQNGATLTIEKGARLLFQTGTHLWIEYGRLVAKGTEQQPVVFGTVNEKTPVAGEWEGIVFGERTLEGTLIDHAIIEYAGRKGAQGNGAITFYGAVRDGSVSISGSILRHHDQAGVFVPEGKARPLLSFEGNTLSDNAGTSLRLPADVVGAIGAMNKLGEPVRISGPVTKSATWPALDVPIVIEGAVAIAGQTERAVLRLAEGTTVRFAKGQQLYVGGGVGGALVAKSVTFTSALETPAPGDWKGLLFDGGIEGSSIEACTFEWAGRETSGVLVLDFEPPKGFGTKKGFTIKSNTFRKNAGPAFWLAGPCGELAKDKLGNVSEGQPLCKE